MVPFFISKKVFSRTSKKQLMDMVSQKNLLKWFYNSPLFNFEE